MQTKLNVKLLTHTPEPEKIISMAAKLCYSNSSIEDLYNDLTPDKINSFLNRLLTYHHESPLEHASFSFGIEGVSRSLTHQLVRARIASHSQQSQRYVRLFQFEYIIPPSIENIPEAKEIFIKQMEQDQESYNELVDILMENKLTDFYKDKYPINKLDNYQDYFEHLLESDLIDDKEKKSIKRKISKIEKESIEDARYVFPNACASKIITTMNLRELICFCKERSCMRSQWEIRNLCIEMIKLVKPICPILYKLLTPECYNGNCKEGNMSCGKSKEVKEFFKNL